jgi:predicted P-loop ATPase
MILPRKNKQQDSNPKKNRTNEWIKVEAYLRENFEFRFNSISLNLQSKRANIVEDWKNVNTDEVYRNLKQKGYRFSHSDLISLLKSDFVPKYNPIESYFNSFDDPENNSYWRYYIGDRDIIDELCKYVYTDDDERFKLHFKKMLVRSIACTLNRKVINKQAFILISENQNTGKTHFLNWLCPPILDEYYTETLSNDKDGLISLGTNFIINIDELAGLKGFEINQLKSLISKDFIKVRLHYDKNTSNLKRIANFVGSTNRTDFLSDETGNVRWLCFKLIDQFNFTYKEHIDVNAIWFSAYELYKSGFEYKLTKEEIGQNEIYNNNFKELSPEHELIVKYFKSADNESGIFMTATEITEELLKVSGIQLKKNQVGKALVNLKFNKTQIVSESLGFPVKGYFVKRK